MPQVAILPGRRGWAATCPRSDGKAGERPRDHCDCIDPRQGYRRQQREIHRDTENQPRCCDNGEKNPGREEQT
jgi:hypothetical protein